MSTASVRQKDLFSKCLGAFKDIHLIFKRLGKCVYRSNKTKCVFVILHDLVDMDLFFFIFLYKMYGLCLRLNVSRQQNIYTMSKKIYLIRLTRTPYVAVSAFVCPVSIF